MSTAKPALVRIPSVKDWVDAPPEQDEAQDLAPNEPEARPPVERMTVVIGVKHNPAKFGKTAGAKGAPNGFSGKGRSGSARSAKAWAKSKAKTDRK